jgi:hypothetical protein
MLHLYILAASAHDTVLFGIVDVILVEHCAAYPLFVLPALDRFGLFIVGGTSVVPRMFMSWKRRLCPEKSSAVKPAKGQTNDVLTPCDIWLQSALTALNTNTASHDGVTNTN